MDIQNDRRRELSVIRNGSYRQYDHFDELAKVRYSVQGAPIPEHELKFDYDDHDNSFRTTQPYGSYDIVQINNSVRQHMRNESRGHNNSFALQNCANTTTQTVMETIYRPQTASKMLQSAHDLSNNTSQKVNEMQSIEMIPFRSNTPVQEDSLENYSLHSSPTKLQGLQRVSQYIQSLPDRPSYEVSHNHVSYHDHEQFYMDMESMSSPDAVVDNASSPVPPPAPPDPPNSGSSLRENGPTTGERIFNALRSVTSQSYIDASEFYK